jgi:hypothetical protein
MSTNDIHYAGPSTDSDEDRPGHDHPAENTDVASADGPVLLPADAPEATDGSPTAADDAPVTIHDRDENDSTDGDVGSDDVRGDDVRGDDIRGDSVEGGDDWADSVDSPAPASAADTVVEGDPVTDPEARADRYDADNQDLAAEPVSEPDAIGPETETGALKDPVADQTFSDDGSTGDTVPGSAGDPFTGDTFTDTSSDSPADPSSLSSAEDDASAGETSVVPVIATGSVEDGDPAAPGAPASPAETAATGASTVDWRELQGKFVDDPESAVKEAGAKVEQALSELRSRIESGDTESLRTAFRRYRDLHADLS